jgi:hypothetical protein
LSYFFFSGRVNFQICFYFTNIYHKLNIAKKGGNMGSTVCKMCLSIRLITTPN